MIFTKDPSTLNIIPIKGIPSVGSTGTASVYDDRMLDQPTGWPLIPFGSERNIYLLIMQLSTDFSRLKEEVILLREELHARPHISSSFINDLNNEKLKVIKSIPIIIEESDEECLARWPEINAFGMGSTISEAIMNLKGNILDLYNDISMRKKKTLGIIALETLGIIKTYIRKKK